MRGCFSHGSNVEAGSLFPPLPLARKVIWPPVVTREGGKPSVQLQSSLFCKKGEWTLGVRIQLILATVILSHKNHNCPQVTLLGFPT
jgi:hypothetical protein